MINSNNQSQQIIGLGYYDDNMSSLIELQEAESELPSKTENHHWENAL